MKLFRSLLIIPVLVLLCASAFAADQHAEDLYKSKCQGCHGPDGRGSMIGKKLGAKDFHDPAVAKMSQSEIITTTTDGKNKMPSYKGKLTDEEMKSLAKYIKEMK